MNTEEFVTALIEAVHKPSLSDTKDILEKPSGRRPPEKMRQLSAWYHELTPDDQTRLCQVIELATHAALFGALCVLDGVRSIDKGAEKTRLELWSVHGDWRELLNSAENTLLHEIYQHRIYQQVFGPPQN